MKWHYRLDGFQYFFDHVLRRSFMRGNEWGAAPRAQSEQSDRARLRARRARSAQALGV
jgi:hypothetical protein